MYNVENDICYFFKQKVSFTKLYEDVTKNYINNCLQFDQSRNCYLLSRIGVVLKKKMSVKRL